MDLFTNFHSQIIASISDARDRLHGDTLCTLALYENAGNGVIAAAFDTLTNSALCAKRASKQAHRNIQHTRNSPDFERLLPGFIDPHVPRIQDYNTSFSDMKHILVSKYYDEIISDESITYGVVLRSFIDIICSISDSDILSSLSISSPFRFGICSGDSDDMWVVNMINWS
jgi:hypothetical protein